MMLKLQVAPGVDLGQCLLLCYKTSKAQLHDKVDGKLRKDGSSVFYRIKIHCMGLAPECNNDLYFL